MTFSVIRGGAAGSGQDWRGRPKATRPPEEKGDKAGGTQPGPTGVWMVLVALLMGAFTLYALWNTKNVLVGMYANIDGQWAAWNLEGLFTWSGPLDLSPFNPLAGMGSLFLPNLPWLNPGAWPFALSWPPDLEYAASYAIYFLELFGSSYLLFRTIGASRAHSFLSAQFMILLFFAPFSAVSNTLSWQSMAPVNAHLASMSNLALLATLRIGEAGRRGDVLWAGLLLVAVLAGFYAAPITILTYVPVYALFFFALIMNRKTTNKTLIKKLLIIAFISSVLFYFGIPNYIDATSAFSERSANVPAFLHPGLELFTGAYWRETLTRFQICGGLRIQFLLCPTGYFSVLQALSILGAAVAAIVLPIFRTAGLTYVAFVGAVHLFSLGSNDRLFGFLSEIDSSYFVWASIPFLAFFLTYPLAAFFDRLQPRHAASPYLAVLIAPALMVVFWFEIIAPTQPPPAAHKRPIGLLPPSATRLPVVDGAIFTALVADIAIAPGAPFRGRTVVYVGDDRGWLAGELGTPAGFPTTVASRHYLDRAFGSTFQETDLWSLGVPTFDEYGQWVSKPAQRLARRLLAGPGDQINPSFLRVYRLNLPVLRLLGTRYVITDAELDEPGVALVAAQDSPRAPGPLRLYRIDGANLATYSPTSIRVAETFDEALALLDGAAPRLRSLGVAFQPPAGPLVPAQESRLTFIRDGWRLKASSPGRSILAVPVQFSNCWEVEDAPGSLRLYRGDAILTFVEFEGSIDIKARFRFGLFGATDCRKRDVADMKSLGL